MIEESATCVICSATLSPLERREGPVCQQASCRWSYRAIPRDQLCRMCGRPLAPKDRASGVCSVGRCQHAEHEVKVQMVKRWERERTLCCICQAPLSTLDLNHGPVCSRPACRWAYQALPAEQVCRVCRRPLAPQDRAAGVCGVPQCRHTEAAERSRRLRERRDAATLELYQIGKTRALVPEPHLYQIAHMPSLRRERKRLPKWRERDFRRYVEELIGEVVASGWDRVPAEPAAATSPGVEASSELDVVSGKACAGCQGECCLTGGTKAWLTVATIKRYHAANPEKSPEEVLADYMARLGPPTYVGSCVYHGRNGCLLPREMRADMCNQWFCAELRVFRGAVPADKPVRAFMVWPEDDGTYTAAFVDGKQSKRVPRKRKKAKAD